MRSGSIVVMSLALASAGVAERIVMRNHAVVEGEVIEKTDDCAVVQEAGGVVTCGWRYMKTSSFKAVHPDRYDHQLNPGVRNRLQIGGSDPETLQKPWPGGHGCA